MKRRFLLAATLTLTLILAAACGDGQKPGSTVPSGGSGTSASAGTALDSRVFKLAHESNPGGPLQVYAEALDKHLKELSGGAYSLQIFTAGQLGDAMACVEQCQAGTLDMVIGGYGNFSSMTGGYPGALGLPYVLPTDVDSVRTMMSDSEAANMLAEIIGEKNIHILGWPLEGADWWSCTKPIHTPADMAGVKFRVIMSAVGLATFEAYGANCTPIPYSELYSSLQLGMVEGQCNPLSSIKDMKFYEVQDYCALTGHIINDNNYIISKIIFDKLSPAQQEAITKATVEAAEFHTTTFQDDEETLIAKFEEQGMTITTPDRAAFREACAPMYDEYVEKYGDAAVKAIEEARG